MFVGELDELNALVAEELRQYVESFIHMSASDSETAALEFALGASGQFWPEDSVSLAIRSHGSAIQRHISTAVNDFTPFAWGRHGVEFHPRECTLGTLDSYDPSAIEPLAHSCHFQPLAGDASHTKSNCGF